MPNRVWAERMFKLAFFHSVNVKNVWYMSHFYRYATFLLCALSWASRVKPICSICWSTLSKVIKLWLSWEIKMRRCPNEWQVLRILLTKYLNRLFWKAKTTKPKCRLSKEPDEEQSVLWVQYSGDSGLGSNRTLRFISKEEAIERLLEIHLSLSGVCKVVGLNSLVRQFGLRFQCNGIKQSAKDFLKACATFHGTLPFLPFPLQHTLSTPMAHLNRYRLMLLIWHLARRGHCKWSLFMTNNRGQYLPRTLFGRYHVGGKERTVFPSSGEGKLSYSIFSLILYLARIMLGENSTQFSLHQVRKLSYSIFSLMLYSAPIRVRGKERTVFLTSGEENLSYSIFSLVLYWTSIILRVKRKQFSLYQGRKVKLQHFISRTLFGMHPC